MSGYMDSKMQERYEMPEEDSRLGLPSASGYGAMIACPGKPNAERGLPELRVEQDDKDADRGTRIHALLADYTGAESIILTDEEIEVAERCDSQTQELVCRLLDTNAPYEDLREQRIWYHVGRDKEDLREQRIWYHVGRDKVFSGQFDRIYIQGSIALLIDYKTGRKQVAASQSNYQLRAGAVLARYEFGVETVHAAIVQPLLIREPAVVTYSGGDIDRAEAELRAALAASSKPDAPRVAGEQCEYCRARLVCPESTGAVKSLASVGSMLEKINEMAPAGIARLLDLKIPAMAVLKAAEAKAFELLAQDPEALRPFGFIEGETVPKRSVEKVGELFSRMNEKYGTPPDVFANICGVTISDTKKLVSQEMKRLGIKLERGSGGLVAEANRLIEGLTTKGKPGRKLVRAGEAIEEGLE